MAKNNKTVALIKNYLHKVSYVLLIVSLVIYSVPAIFTVFDALLSGSAGGEYGLPTNKFKGVLASLCFLFNWLSYIPGGEYILGALTLIVAGFNYIWRRIRGHRRNRLYIILYIITLVVFVTALLSCNTLLNYLD